VIRAVVDDSVLPPVGIENQFAGELELFGAAVNDVIMNNTSAFDALTQAQRQIDSQ